MTLQSHKTRTLGPGYFSTDGKVRVSGFGVQNFEAKLADFGLAKDLAGATHVTTGVMGTLGYLDPAYAQTGGGGDERCAERGESGKSGGCGLEGWSLRDEGDGFTTNRLV